MAFDWGMAALALGLGLGIGFLAAVLILPGSKRLKQLEEELEQAREDHSRYRNQVTNHFKRTAELFEELTDRYRAVYQHLASSARDLCEGEPEMQRLDFTGPHRLEREPAPAATRTPPPADNGLLGDAPQVPRLDDEVTREEAGQASGAAVH